MSVSKPAFRVAPFATPIIVTPTTPNSASVADLMKVSNINKQVAESIYAELSEE